METLEKTLRAMANRRRLALCAYLKYHREASVIELSAQLRFSYRATSKHLRQLADAQVVSSEQRGVEMSYRLAVPATPVVATILEQLSPSPSDPSHEGSYGERTFR